MRIMALTFLMAFLPGCFVPIGDANIMPYHKDEKRRMGLFKASTPEAQYDLAMTFCCEDVERRDYEVASRWFCQAAKGGYTKAAARLGDLFRSDKPPHLEAGKLPDNDILAYAWYSIGARWKDIESIRAKAEMDKKMTIPQIQAASVYVERFPDTPCVVSEF